MLGLRFLFVRSTKGNREIAVLQCSPVIPGQVRSCEAGSPIICLPLRSRMPCPANRRWWPSESSPSKMLVLLIERMS